MTWFGWILVAAWSINALCTVALIGRKRGPVTPASAVTLLIIHGLLVWGASTVGTTP